MVAPKSWAGYHGQRMSPTPSSETPLTAETEAKTASSQPTRVALRSIAFGDPTAEGDEDFLFDRSCYYETDIYKRCLELCAPLFVVGRRGSGKSATRMALAKHFVQDSKNLVIVISPQAFHFAHAKALARAMMRDVDVNWEFLFTSVWATVLRGAWAEALVNYYRIRNTPRDDLKVLEDFVEKVVQPDTSPSQRVSLYLKEAAETIASGGKDVVGELQKVLQSFRAEGIGPNIRRVAEESGLRLITLIDGLDENWDGSNTSAQLISGLLTQCAGDYPSTGAISYVFIRENMYRRVSALSTRWDRIEGYFTTMSWSPAQLGEVVLTRLRRSVGVETLDWSDVFEPNVDTVATMDYLIGRTQAKPRELILFCRYALDSAIAARETRVTARSIREAERRYSDNRLRDLINEYQDAIPELRGVIDVFLGEVTDVPLDELFRRLSEFMASGRYGSVAPQLSLTHPNPEALLDLLLGLGFVGVRLKDSKEFVFKYYGEQGNAFSSLDQIERVAIHPAFHSALGVKKPLGSVAPISVREAEDEDLVGASAAIAVRSIAASEQATQMMAALKETPLGMGGFRRYEELVRDVVAFAFTGYLDNGRMQERNWAGTQVRDVVFDNTGETLFFSHVRDKFHAITFLFECKNKETLEAADFHQMESRLSDATGNVGFICYRSNRAEPVRSEIEHLRSIFSRSHQQKLVMLLSDANLSQVLSKRLRGKLDRFMYSMLTRYASLYLAS